METKKDRTGRGARLVIGALVLEGVLQVDTKLVKARVSTFTALHRRYVSSQRKVEMLEAQQRALQAQLLQRDIEQDEAVEALACVLSTDGQPRANPFAAFGAVAPSLLKRLRFAAQATAIDHLVAAVQRSKTVTEASRDAAQVTQKAARAVKAVRAQAKGLEARLHKARRRRDAIGERWDKTLAALKRRTRSAADDGGTDLHPALFGRAAWHVHNAAVSAAATT